MSQPAIEIRGLTKTYRAGLRRRPVYAVRNVDLTVPTGAIVAFVGPNGAGKTTTIHSLLGLLKPDRGTVSVFGAPRSPEHMRSIGYQPEIFHPYPFYTARQALRFYGRLSGMDIATIEAAIPPLLQRVGLSDAANRAASTFSKGMTQRLGLAQAMLHDPKVLVLDEPTSGLDPEGRRLVLDIIAEQKAHGRTILMSSHILPDVERTCDEVVMIRAGEVAFCDVLRHDEPRHEWEIEVVGWTAATHAQLAGCTFSILAEEPDRARVVCTSNHKNALLHRLTSLAIDGAGVEIGTVQRARGLTLEERYLQHLGTTDV